jgi:GNAT superfamily N-acetyltransferase
MEEIEFFKNTTKVLTSKVSMSEIDEEIFKTFDYDFKGETSFTVPELPPLPDEFNIGVICGASGSGKSSILKQFGEEEVLVWDNDKTVASHFDGKDDAIERLCAVGLNSVPTWAKPRRVLSNGEGFRADLARRLKDGAVIDEFTSVVNRDVAKSCSRALQKYVKRKNIKNIVIATCHSDILDWLEPDWVYDTDTKEISRRSLRQPKIEIKIHKCSKDYWQMFSQHHYLTSKLPNAVRCFLATWNGVIVGFAASISLPGKIPPLYEGDTRNKFRGCRTVVLPDFQGLGIGTRLSDKIADIHIEDGYRYFSKTSHPRMGEYRENSELWRPTSTNLADRSKSRGNKSIFWHHYKLDIKRICYSHEYIGKDNKSYDPKWMEINKKQGVLF